MEESKNYQYRSTTYEIPLYTYDFFCEIDNMCKEWLEKGCSTKTISYEGFIGYMDEKMLIGYFHKIREEKLQN